MIGRSELYEKLGYNVVLFEMRAHGGNQPVNIGLQCISVMI